MKAHAQFVKLGLDKDTVIGTRLVNAYASSRCPSSLSLAHQLFDEIPHKDTILYSSLISAYSHSYPLQALRLFSHLLSLPLPHPQPNQFTFSAAARAAASIRHLPLAQTIQASSLKRGLHSSLVVRTAFVHMYSKCHDVESARKMFDETPEKNLTSYNALISGYSSIGMENCAMGLFYRMKCIEFELPDEFSVSSMLTACAGAGAGGNGLSFSLQIHAYIVRSGLDSDHRTAGALASMYFRCGEVGFGDSVLEKSEGSVTSKLIKIKGYVLNGRFGEALASIDGKFVETVLTDPGVIISVLSVCAKHSLLRIGRQVHVLFITTGCSLYDEDICVAIETALIDMYCKCLCIARAQEVFSNLPMLRVSHWNSMITGYIHNGLLDNARDCFDRMPERNVISWTAMMSGYVKRGSPHEALNLLSNMYRNNRIIRGNYFTFATALDACCILTALDAGKQIHAKSIRTLSNIDCKNVVLETTLLYMYSKSGNLTYSRRVFDQMRDRNVVTWTSMIMGYAIHGHGPVALDAFQEMLQEDLEPNDVTFVAVLSACSHSGLVEEGKHYFKLMREKFGIVPREDHYTCMVALLGRAGKLNEASSFLEDIVGKELGSYREKKVDCANNGPLLGALLGGCHLHGNVELGKRVAKMMLDRKEQVSETFVALSNVYAFDGMWDEAYKVRQEQKNRRIVKEPGHSQIQIACFG